MARLSSTDNAHVSLFQEQHCFSHLEHSMLPEYLRFVVLSPSRRDIRCDVPLPPIVHGRRAGGSVRVKVRLPVRVQWNHLCAAVHIGWGSYRRLGTRDHPSRRQEDDVSSSIGCVWLCLVVSLLSCPEFTTPGDVPFLPLSGLPKCSSRSPEDEVHGPQVFSCETVANMH